MQNILVIGGAGYVGAVLVPKLLDKGYAVRVLDLMLFGEDVLPQHPKLEVVKGDMDERTRTEIHRAAGPLPTRRQRVDRGEDPGPEAASLAEQVCLEVPDTRLGTHITIGNLGAFAHDVTKVTSQCQGALARHARVGKNTAV